ncbi:hypothetical protein [Streptomyces sp. WAC06614]|uniref:hypothetical protein n=1 Tax=Streptomyces sp. WAC06614 TaxID=2487416 RepID=UPI000F7935BB|nr:hypothetical protein [Streptomyces sp. WAC06614]RSS78655.1 hypothetical protein EF918_20170 [Streptomyces sp. WAC06614]
MYTCQLCQGVYEAADVLRCPDGCAGAAVCQGCAQEFGCAVRCDCGKLLDGADGAAGATGAAPLRCTVCCEDFSGEDYGAGRLFACPRGCNDEVMCRGCFSGYRAGWFPCSRCEEVLTDCHGAPATVVREDRFVGMAAPPGPGRQQQGMQCYAAAVATACAWALGVDLTTDEAMHLYLMSDQAARDGDTVDAYRAAYLTATELVVAGAGVARVHEAMRKRVEGGEAALRAAVNAYGCPVFPEGTAHFYVPRLSGDHIEQALAQGCVVMMGIGLHWIVVHGCEVDAAGRVVAVHTYNPSRRNYGPDLWLAAHEGAFEGYVVGRSSL